jgi:ribonuclease P protein component
MRNTQPKTVFHAQTLPKLARLRTKEQFDRVFKAGKKISSGGVAIFYNQNDQTQARMGIVVTKRNVPLATQRNSLKRVVRESFRQRRHLFPNVDVIVYLYASAKSFSNAKLHLCLEQLWTRLISLAQK